VATMTLRNENVNSKFQFDVTLGQFYYSIIVSTLPSKILNKMTQIICIYEEWSKKSTLTAVLFSIILM
jgi:hypothetical protein